jgi:hypothetical protein
MCHRGWLGLGVLVLTACGGATRTSSKDDGAAGDVSESGAAGAEVGGGSLHGDAGSDTRANAGASSNDAVGGRTVLSGSGGSAQGGRGGTVAADTGVGGGIPASGGTHYAVEGGAAGSTDTTGVAGSEPTEAGGSGGAGETGGAAGSTDTTGVAGSEPTEAGGSGGAGETGGTAGAENATGGGWGEPLCPDEPTPNTATAGRDCEVGELSLGLDTICDESCPITRTLEVTCSSGANTMRMTATDNGVALQHEDELILIDDATSNVYSWPDGTFLLGRSHVGTVDVARMRDGFLEVVGARGTWGGAMSRTGLDEYSIVDDFLVGSNHSVLLGNQPRWLSTWASPCWVDAEVLLDAYLQLTAELDGDDKLWLLGTKANPDANRGELWLFDLEGTMELVATKDGFMDATAFGTTMIVPGGYEGNDAYPLVSTRDEEGLHVFQRVGAENWEDRLLPGTEPMTDTNDCPISLTVSEHNTIPTDCTPEPSQCHGEIAGVGDALSIVRDTKGRLFAIWPEYQGSYTTTYELVHDDLTLYGDGIWYWCSRVGFTNTGTIDVTVAQLTEADIVPTQFHIPLNVDWLPPPSKGVLAAVSGDSLSVLVSPVDDHFGSIPFLQIDLSQL